VGIEAIPANPEHRSADVRQDDAVRREVFLPETKALAQDDAQDQTGPTGGHMHDRPAGEVKTVDRRVRVPAAVHHPVDAPDHVTLGVVHQQNPQRHEHEDGRELHAFRNGTHDERRSDDGKHQLEHGIDVFRHPVRVARIRRGSNALEHPANAGIAHDAFNPVVGHAQRAGRCAIAAKDHPVTANHPQDRRQTGDQETLGEHREHVLLADKTAVEQCQTGQRHKQYQRRAGQQPGIMTGAGVGHIIALAVNQVGVDDRSTKPKIHRPVAVGILVRKSRVAI